MGKIKAKQLALVAAFTSGSGEALDLAEGGIAASKLAGGITVDKLAQSLINQIVTGQRQQPSVLVPEQLLAGSSGGVCPAALVVVSANPSANDTFGLKKMGSGAETFTFKGSESSAFDVAIGVDEAATAANLVAAINADSANFSAVVVTTLDKIAGTCVVVYCNDTNFTGGSKVFATTGTGLVYIDFAGGRYDAKISSTGALTPYAAADLAALPTSEPSTTNLGFNRVFASMFDGDLRFVMSANSSYLWDGDASSWENANSAVIAAGGVGVDEISSAIAGAGLGGGSGAALSVNVDDTGIEINSDTLRLKDGGVSAGKLAATSVTAAKLGADVAGNGLTGGNGNAISVLAVNTSVDVSGSGVKSAVPVKDDKALAPSGAISTDDADTGITITKTPAAGSYVGVSLNGVRMEVGDGVKTKDCYFTADNGSTARSIADIAATDKLYWNAVISGINLSTNDEIDLDYLNTTS